MRFKAIFGVILASLLASGAAAADVRSVISRQKRDHPRLFLSRDEEAPLRQKIESDPVLTKALAYVTSTADEILTVKPVERTLVGIRLSEVTRKCLKRVLHLSLAYRLTKNTAYASRAQEEMLAAAGFSDWNPGVFLEVAEMTTALAIGYDWLHDTLTPEARTTIKNAIVDKGLRPSIQIKHGWVTAKTNWNQVCHGGFTLGALAVLESEPEIASFIIDRAVQNVPNSMAEYAPDGAYPEGPGYWDYGTTYNVLLIAAMESALGTDFRLSEKRGFLESSDYYLQVVGPTGLYFNYSDCGPRGEVAPAMYWFAKKRSKPSLLWNEKDVLNTFLNQKHDGADLRNGFFPLTLLWAAPQSEITAPEVLNWKAGGKTPIAIHRSEWLTKNATFAGLKGGSPSTPHAHMDIGSFVIDSQYVRWAEDLGMEQYNDIESKGIKLWDNSQNGQRWDVFRLSNLSHNTLVVDGQKQRVAGNAPIIGFSDRGSMPYAIVNMTSVYQDQLALAKRGIGLRSDASVLVQDEIETLKRKTSVRWGMVTRAAISLDDDQTATLNRNNRRMTMRILEPSDAKFELIETENPPNDYDAKNKGTQMIGFTISLEPSRKIKLAVLVSPGASTEEVPKLRPLADWSKE